MVEAVLSRKLVSKGPQKLDLWSLTLSVLGTIADTVISAAEDRVASGTFSSELGDRGCKSSEGLESGQEEEGLLDGRHFRLKQEVEEWKSETVRMEAVLLVVLLLFLLDGCGRLEGASDIYIFKSP